MSDRPGEDGDSVFGHRGGARAHDHRERMTTTTTTWRTRIEHTLVWRVWERMLEIEFVDRSIALAGKAFVSFFPLMIVVAAFMPDRIRSAIVTTVTNRLGMEGDSLELARGAFASASDMREATTVLGLLLTVFFATSFTTALQRVYLRAWRRPPTAGVGRYGRGVACILAVLLCTAVLGGLRGLLEGGLGVGVFAVVSIAATSTLWWFISWHLLQGAVRARVLIPTGLITAVLMAGFAVSATVWMPEVVTSNEEQFGFFGVALSLVTWFSGAAGCVVVGACAGPVLSEDVGPVGAFIRGSESRTLVAGASPPLPPPTRELNIRDAFQSTDDE